MKNALEKEIVNVYLKTYKDLLSSETIDDRSVALSFPLHVSGNHRIELAVTQVTNNSFVITDVARVVTELKSAGVRLNRETRERIESIASVAGLKIENEYLLLQTTRERLGEDIHKFVETAKTIGDVYLIHSPRKSRHKEIAVKVKTVLDSKNVPYQERFKLSGQFEPHTVDFYVPANGSQALALAILEAGNTRQAAEIWGFRCDDIKRQAANKGLRIGIVYDSAQPWKDEEKAILQDRASLLISNDEVDRIKLLVGKH